MKRLSIFVLMIVTLCADIYAQKYLRYHMNDSTFNGFYTETIEKITHDLNGGSPTSYVYSLGKMYEIPLNTVDSITVENASLTDGDAPNYRIYEFNSKEGNVKKIYIDNRACLLASSNGDFGAKDTILFSSAYNNIKWLIFTNESGMIKKIFDGNKLFFFDYEENGDFTVLDLSTRQTEFYKNSNLSDSSSERSLTRASILPIIFRRLRQTVRPLAQPMITTTEHGQFFLGVGAGFLDNYLNNLDHISNNPENHNQQLINDYLSVLGGSIAIGRDVALLAAALVPGGAALSGWAIASLIADAGFLLSSLNDLVDHLWPDSEQMKIYKEYYKNKYSISLKTLPAENISFTSATLRGNLSYTGKLSGNFSFELSSLNSIDIPASVKSVDKYNYSITADAKDLNPGYYYYYYLKCTFTVDGLHLDYISDNYTELYTPFPNIETRGYENNGPQSTTLYGHCIYDWDSYFKDNVEPKVGFAYSEDGNSWSYVASSLGFDGNFSATLQDIDCLTNYYYKAYVETDGVKVFGDIAAFESAPPSIDGAWQVSQGDGESFTVHFSNGVCTWSKTMEKNGSYNFVPNAGIEFGVFESWWLGFGTNWVVYNFSGTLNNKNHPTSISGNVVRNEGNEFSSHDTYKTTFTAVKQ